MIALLGVVASVFVLASYAVAQHRKNMHIFDWGNAIGFVPLGISSLVVGAWGALIVTVVFGLLGIWGLLRADRSPL